MAVEVEVEVADLVVSSWCGLVRAPPRENVVSDDALLRRCCLPRNSSFLLFSIENESISLSDLDRPRTKGITEALRVFLCCFFSDSALIVEEEEEEEEVEGQGGLVDGVAGEQIILPVSNFFEIARSKAMLVALKSPLFSSRPIPRSNRFLRSVIDSGASIHMSYSTPVVPAAKLIG